MQLLAALWTRVLDVSVIMTAHGWDHLLEFWIAESMMEGAPMICMAAVVKTLFKSSCDMVNCERAQYGGLLLSLQVRTAVDCS